VSQPLCRATNSNYGYTVVIYFITAGDMTVWGRSLHGAVLSQAQGQF